MNIKRIEHAIKVGEKIPRKKFHLESWATDVGGFTKFHPRMNGCGTYACYAGWMASNPKCIREGLYLERGLWGAKTEAVVVFQNRLQGFEAIAEYLDIDLGTTATIIFSPAWYTAKEHKQPEAVMQRLQLLLDLEERRFYEFFHALGCNKPQDDVMRDWQNPL